MQDVLDSDLPDSYKFWACKGLAPDDCPEMHAVLAGLMPEQAWASRKVMLRYAAELMPRKNTQSLALPDAFDID